MAQEKRDYDFIEKIIIEDVKSIEIDTKFKNDLKKRILASNKLPISEAHTSPQVISIWDKIKLRKEPKHFKAASILLSLLITGSVAVIFNNNGFQNLICKDKNRDNINSDIVNTQVDLKVNDNKKLAASNYNDYINETQEINSDNIKKDAIQQEKDKKAEAVANNSNVKLPVNNVIETIKNDNVESTKKEDPVSAKDTKSENIVEQNNEPNNILVNEIGSLSKNYASNGKTVIKELKISNIKFQAEMPKATVLNIKGDKKDTGKIEFQSEIGKEDQKSSSKNLVLVKNSNDTFLYEASKGTKYILKKIVNLSEADKNDSQKNSKEIEKENKQLEIDFEKLFGEKTIYSFLKVDISDNGKEVYLTTMNGENKKEEIIKLDCK